MKERYPRIAAFLGWLMGSLLPAAIGYAVGFTHGHDAGRLEMKCAIFAVIERLGDIEPVPGTISLGCEKHR